MNPIRTTTDRTRHALAALARGLAGLRGWRRAGVSFVLGGTSVLALAPFHLWPLLFVTFPALVWLLDGVAEDAPEAKRAALRRAALVGWCFGFGYFVAGLYWMGFAFLVEAEKFAALMPLAVAAFPAGLALFYGAAAAGAMALWRPGARRIFALATTLFAVEWLRGHILTGFPWNLWGYALAGNDAIAQSASLFGAYGLTFLAILIFASPAALAGRIARADARNWPLPALCMVLLAGGWLWGQARLSAAQVEFHPGIQMRIVQGNIPQAEKWKPENRGWIFERLTTLSRNGPEGKGQGAKISHLIWPETSVPFLFMLNGQIAIDQARDAFAELLGDGTVMILGAERIDGERLPDNRVRVDQVYNTLFALDDQARILGRYDKVHLVPFGEYLPFEPALRAVGVAQLTHLNTGFTSGAARTPMVLPGTPPFSPLICYEAVFPAKAQDASGEAAWLLNLTNDAWFGHSIGPYQHLFQVRLRAVEEGLPLVRVANTGISAIIDPYGRILASLPLDTMGVMDQPLPKSVAATAFRAYGEMSLMVVAILAILLYRFVIKVE